MPVTLRRLEVGQLQANCYVLGCETTHRGAIIDPGGDAHDILAAVAEKGLVVDLILNTHGHPDHIAANCAVRERLAQTQGHAPRLLVHEADRGAVERPPMQWLLIGMRPDRCPVDGTLAEGDELTVGDLRLRVLHLPGHSPGSVALVVEDAVFTGDVLFAGGIGRTDLPGGNDRQMTASLKRLVAELPPETVVYPGHGEATTIAQERETNGWLKGL